MFGNLFLYQREVAAFLKKMESAAADVEHILPDLTFISSDQAAELHAMIPGFKPWPVGS